MTDQAAEPPPKRPLFRPEAVEHHAKARVGTRRLDLDDRRVAWQFRGLLGGIAVALLLAFTIRTETSANVPAVAGTRNTRVYALVRDPVPAGTVVRVEIGGRTLRGRVAGVEREGTLAITLDEPSPVAGEGRAEIPLGRRSVVAILLGWGR